MRQPKVFLFDEPLSNLDAKLRVELRTEISKLHNRLKTTMIYVTHDQVEAMTLGDKIIIMRDGVIQQNGTPVNLYDYPVNKFVAGFIGSPSMNFITGQVEDVQGLVFNNGSMSFQINTGAEDKLKDFVGKEIIFGIRPEDISISGEEEGIPMVVEILEMMGNEIYLYLTMDQNTIIARVPPDTKVEEGQKVDVIFDFSKVHYFEPDSQKRI
ncbi:MAG: TOBE domain-containing protein [Candidatus Marinimicrobia bacterium]|nr:TOBE domain-containing protein [Candidatus Neomarinimicrobiota bacterium]